MNNVYRKYITLESYFVLKIPLKKVYFFWKFGQKTIFFLKIYEKDYIFLENTVKGCILFENMGKKTIFFLKIYQKNCIFFWKYGKKNCILYENPGIKLIFSENLSKLKYFWKFISKKLNLWSAVYRDKWVLYLLGEIKLQFWWFFLKLLEGQSKKYKR